MNRLAIAQEGEEIEKLRAQNAALRNGMDCANKDMRIAYEKLVGYETLFIYASAAIEDAVKLRAELDALNSQEPIAWVFADNRDGRCYSFNGMEILPDGKHHLYARPVPAIPEGYALVPVDPTNDMLAAAQKSEMDHSNFEDWINFDGGDCIRRYRAMIAVVRKGGE